MRAVVGLAAVVHIGMLLVIKYTAFFTGNINSILAAVGSATKLAIPKYVMPVGISFFTMQAMSYIFDVYRGKIKADGNLVRVALFISSRGTDMPLFRHRGQTLERNENRLR